MNSKLMAFNRLLEIMTHFHITQRELSNRSQISYQVIKNAFSNPDLMSFKRWMLLIAEATNYANEVYNETSQHKILKMNTGVINDE